MTEIIEYIDEEMNYDEKKLSSKDNNNLTHNPKKNNKNATTEELSTTLIERRKRFHELASEINQWEDEATTASTKNIHNNLINSTPPPPAPPYLQLDNKSTPQNYSSPKFRVRSPSPFRSTGATINSNMNNKENKSPYLPSYQTVTSASSILNKNSTNNIPTAKQQQFATPSNTEIVNVAQRFLSKRNSNSQPTESTTSNQDNITNSESLVKSIKSRFENNKTGNDAQDSASHMTPKLIIKKFEQMLKDGTQVQPLTGTVITSSAPTAVCTSTNSTEKSKKVCGETNNVLKTNTINRQTPVVAQNESTINTDHIKPKSIIEKFESLVKSQQVTNIPVTFSSGTISSNGSSDQENKKTSIVSTGSYYTTGSLTYVSSMTAESIQVSPTGSSTTTNQNEEEDEEAIYEELNNHESANNQNKNQTSLFEDTNSIRSDLTGTASTYSVNEDIDDQDTDFMSNDDYEEDDYIYYDQENEMTTTQNDETNCDNTLYNQTNDYSAYEQNTQDAVCESTSKLPPLVGNATYTINTNNQNNNNNSTDAELFSIKEYRKQKRRLLNGGRRSSIMPNNRLTMSGVTTTSTNPSSTMNIKSQNTKTSTSKLNTPKNTQSDSSSITAKNNDNKKKMIDKIKELEELIKQEDNIIHQTGVALEKCISDANFTGSSEHIECNRILLISCQKRQAYSSEINRLKQLISVINLNSKQKIVNENTQSDESSTTDNEISQADLTGLLIFSDIQLPIKQEYINKLRSGEEKRVFYFLCLVRHGTQVVQTQVISAQELIATRETSITFPNRIAISNVDVNFKVKVDVYTFEVSCSSKDNKNGKQSSSHSSSHSFSYNKFFSPLKNNLLNLQHHITGHHHGSHSNSGNSANSATSSHYNHHFNQQGVVSNNIAGSKTSNFIHVHTLEVTIKDIYLNKFQLKLSSSSIPLTGLLYMNVRCMPSKSIELKGFMTLFEDVNGMGSWDRRWCFLSNYNISYWKYPEDEYRNGPLGIINLNKCLNEKCSILPRDICARKYTIELSILNNDQSPNVESIDQNQNKVKRYRLSADTKDQAAEWLTNINFAIANLRLWNPKAFKPSSSSNK